MNLSLCLAFKNHAHALFRREREDDDDELAEDDDDDVLRRRFVLAVAS